MKWKAIVAATVLAGVAFGSVIAADGTHDSRIALMKKIGGAAGALGAIAKGDKPYDAAVVKTSLTTIAETAKAFPDQFGPNSDKTDARSIRRSGTTSMTSRPRPPSFPATPRPRLPSFRPTRPASAPR